jgi:hypothetical protein
MRRRTIFSAQWRDGTSPQPARGDAAAADLTLADDEFTYLAAAADRFRPTPSPGEKARRLAGQAARRARQLAGVERWWDRR